MATKICPECKNAIDENAPYCPFCGHEFALSEKPGENEPSERTKRKRRKNVSVVANDETIVEHVPVETVAKKKETGKEPVPERKEAKPVSEIKKPKPEAERPDKVVIPKKSTRKEEGQKVAEDLGEKIIEEAEKPDASDAENISEKDSSEIEGRNSQVKEETDKEADDEKTPEKKSSRRKRKDEAVGDNPSEEKAPVVEYDANWDGYYDDVKAEYEEMKAQYNADNMVKVIWTVVLMVAAFIVYFIFAFK